MRRQHRCTLYGKLKVRRVRAVERNRAGQVVASTSCTVEVLPNFHSAVRRNFVNLALFSHSSLLSDCVALRSRDTI